MLTTMVPAPAAPSATARAEATHERRNWVRLTFTCNNRCRFCLDASSHDGAVRDRNEIVRQIVDGRRAGATRLVLSGGEPTLHPSFVDFVRLGARLGYRRIQTVSNGRLFAYPELLGRALDAGLGEITFSIHGPDAATHDPLVGVPGAYQQTLVGLRHALADGRPVVNVDVVLTRSNVDRLRETLARLTALGVREFELLWAVPFGRAFGEGRDLLLDADCLPAIQAALAEARRSGVTVWLSRVPPELLEGNEDLIGDPHKLLDEIRGRAPELGRYLREGVALDCQDGERCRRCALEAWCAALEETWARLGERRYTALRFDTQWEQRQQSPFGADPASERRAYGAFPSRARRAPLEPATLSALATAPQADTLILAAPDLGRARDAMARLPWLPLLELELDASGGLEHALDHGELDGRTLVRTVVGSVDDAVRMLAVRASFEVVVLLSPATAPWLRAQRALWPRLGVRQPSRAPLLGGASEEELARFFAELDPGVPVEGLPACIAGRQPRARPAIFELGVLDPAGRIEPFRFTRLFIAEHARTKSTRCRQCVHDGDCQGLHLQQVRAGGYRLLRPVRASGP
jgi:MoaA/NifB/PqqE/SkfB family radical SAM enzyme